MNAENIARSRASCHLHFLSRAVERNIVLTADDVVRLENLIERMRPVFEVPGVTRYKLRARRSGKRVRVVYDTNLRCVVSIWPHGKGSPADA